MATVITRLCDWHLAKKEEEVAGSPRSIPVFGVKKPLIDLCDDCYQQQVQVHVEALAALAQELGRREDESQGPIATPARPKRDLIPCPAGCSNYAASRHSYRDHMADVHDVTLAVWEGRNGKTVDGLPITVYCDYDDCEAGFSTPQGKGAHMSHEHGYQPNKAKKAAKKPAKKAS